MLTDFGKLIRKLRIDRGLRLYDMAQNLGKSTAWLSYIETGRKPIPAKFADQVADFYKLSDQEREELNEAAAQSTSTFKFKIDERSSRTRINTAYALARKFDGMDDETLGEFLKLLKEKD